VVELRLLLLRLQCLQLVAAAAAPLLQGRQQGTPTTDATGP